jgi:4-diphosphocytidyl-2-C-methyl-D-erythritol kinase
MLPISLVDSIRAEVIEQGIEVDCAVSAGADNLACRAVRALEARLERTLPVRLTIAKRIPYGAGLGGGSSDAAAALRAVDELYGLDTPAKVLYEVAGEIGSDVPFFLWPGAQLSMGRGTVLAEAELPSPLHLVVVAPPVSVSTPKAYGWWDEREAPDLKAFAARTARLTTAVRAARTVRAVAALVHNDLEPYVVGRHPVVGAIVERLTESGALAAAMSGSGSAAFGLFAGDQPAAAAARDLTVWAASAGGDAAGLRAIHVTDLQAEEGKTPPAPRPPG